MRIDGEIGVDANEPWLARLREESRLAPFNSLLSAVNLSLGGHRFDIFEAERLMMTAAALGLLAAGIAVAVYSSGQPELAAILTVGALVCAINFARARERRIMHSSVPELMEKYLISAGFKLAWSKDTMNSHRPAIVTLEWPGN